MRKRKNVRIMHKCKFIGTCTTNAVPRSRLLYVMKPVLTNTGVVSFSSCRDFLFLIFFFDFSSRVPWVSLFPCLTPIAINYNPHPS